MYFQAQDDPHYILDSTYKKKKKKKKHPTYSSKAT